MIRTYSFYIRADSFRTNFNELETNLHESRIDKNTMRITPRQYAEALYQAVQDKKDSEVKSAIKNFAGIISENNDLKKVNKIIEQFSKLWNKEKRIVEVEIASARELDKKIIFLIDSHIAGLLKAKEIIINQKIDKNLLGGVVIRYGDKVLDASLKTKLEELREEMVK